MILGELFNIHINSTMTNKICGSEQQVIIKCLTLVKSLKIHSVLNCDQNIRKQFYFVVFPLNTDCNRIAIYFFKKKYDTVKKIFINKFGTCKKCFILDFTLEDTTRQHWLEIEKNKIQNFYVRYLKEINIKVEQYDNYLDMFFGNNDTNFTIEDIWGETVNPFNINWLMTIEVILKKDYGLDFNENCNIPIPLHTNFRRTTLNEIYYPDYNSNNPIYNNIEKFTLFSCDYCDNFFDNQHNNRNLWHNEIFGDMCNICYIRHKNNFFKKYAKICKKIKYIANKQLFNFELEKTKRILNQNKNMKLSIDEKYLIQKNIIKALVKEDNGENCSVCLDKFHGDLVVGRCGHVLHKKCWDYIVDLKCPVCREESQFTKLYI